MARVTQLVSREEVRTMEQVFHEVTHALASLQVIEDRLGRL